jgi:hypothetical protein
MPRSITTWPAITNADGLPPPDADLYGGLWPPETVAVDGNRLRFTLPKLPPAAPSLPDRATLVDLSRIADAGCPPERLRRFAAKWGPLDGIQTGGCGHAPGEPHETVRRNLLDEHSGGTTRQAVEYIECWQRMAEHFRDLLRLLARADTDQLARDRLRSELLKLTLTERLGLLPVLTGGRPQVVLASSTLPGYLTLAMLGLWAALAGRALPRLCAACGGVFDDIHVYRRRGRKVRRGPRRDRPYYCASCRADGRARSDIVRRWKAKSSARLTPT